MKRFVSIAVAKTNEVGQKAIDYWERTQGKLYNLIS